MSEHNSNAAATTAATATTQRSDGEPTSAPDMLTLSRHVRPGTVAYEEHVRACQRAARTGRGRADFARAMGAMLRGWSEYADAYVLRYSGPTSDDVALVGEDGVLGDAWQRIGEGLRNLLNGEVGGLDCGSIDANVLDCMARNGAGEVDG